MNTNLKGGGNYLRMNEIKFWNLPPTEYDSNFWERYYGRSFKYYATLSPYLSEIYMTRATSPLKDWPPTINPANTAIVPVASKIAWIDDSALSVRLCPPEYRFNDYNKNCT
jgi:hypothetical protein